METNTPAHTACWAWVIVESSRMMRTTLSFSGGAGIVHSHTHTRRQMCVTLSIWRLVVIETFGRNILQHKNRTVDGDAEGKNLWTQQPASYANWCYKIVIRSALREYKLIFSKKKKKMSHRSWFASCSHSHLWGIRIIFWMACNTNGVDQYFDFYIVLLFEGERSGKRRPIHSWKIYFKAEQWALRAQRSVWHESLEYKCSLLVDDLMTWGGVCVALGVNHSRESFTHRLWRESEWNSFIDFVQANCYLELHLHLK